MARVSDREERLAFIQQKLAIRGMVLVVDLSKDLGTTSVTIRKDLFLLEQQGRLRRVTGGAVSTNSVQSQPVETQLMATKNYTYKESVAKTAANLIGDGDSLIVTSGATPHLTLRYAEQRRNLKILTDSLIIAEDLCRKPDYQVIILGGEIYTRDSFVHGRDAVRQASLYMADKAIVTMDGVDVAAGLSTLRVEGADTLKSILTRARKRIVVADSTKIGVESFCHIADITVMDILVTNHTDDPRKLRILKKIADKGVEIMYAEPESAERQKN